MKKYSLYFILIVMLAIIAGWFIYNNSDSTINKRESGFAIDKPENVFQIRLTDNSGKSVLLIKKEKFWMVNDKYVCRDEMIGRLLEVMHKNTGLSPVPMAAHDNVIRDMVQHNVKAEIFMGNDRDKPTKVYYVGGQALNSKGTYMLMEIDGKMASRPYITYIPGFEGYVTSTYCTDEEKWRTQQVFNYKRDEIQRITIDYTFEKENSFTISRVGKDSFALNPLEEQFKNNESYKQEYIHQYLDFYSSISIEQYDNHNPAKDTIMSSEPFCTISIKEKDGTINTVKLLRMPINERSKKQVDDKGNMLKYDTDEFYAALHGGKELAYAQFFVFGKLLRNYHDFFFKPLKEQAKTN